MAQNAGIAIKRLHTAEPHRFGFFQPSPNFLYFHSGIIAKYGFLAVTDLAAAKHQWHIVTETFNDLIRRLTGETDYKKPDGLEFYDTQEPWEGSTLT